MKKRIEIYLLLIVLCTLFVPTLAQSTVEEIIGEVVSTAGDDITVAFTGSKMPEIGWSVDLFYVVPKTGRELPVGTWQVQSVDGQTVIAVKVKGQGNANTKLKAVLHNRQKKQPVASPSAPQPQRTRLVNNRPVPADPKPFQSSSARPSQQIQLLGQSSPASFAQNKKVHARHILLQNKKEAMWIIDNMEGLSGNKLKEKFINKAKIMSTCPTGKKGGDLGTFERGRMVAEFDNVVFSMRPGTISATPVKTKYGYHVIYREEEVDYSLATNSYDSSPKKQIINIEPNASDKKAFAEYKRELERKQEKLTSLQHVQRSAKTYWSPAKYWVGIRIADNDLLLGQVLGLSPTGARVLWIHSSSPVKRALNVADIICEANGVKVQNAEQFKKIVQKATEQKIKLKIQRNYEVIEKTVKLKKLK